MNLPVIVTSFIMVVYCHVTQVDTAQHKHAKRHHRRRHNMILRALASGRSDPWDETIDGTLSREQMEFFCKKDYNSSMLCSRHGACVRGHCVCDEVVPGDPTYGRYMGQYCQYDLNVHVCALSHNPGDIGVFCGGPGRGECVAGRCQCSPGYTGTFCGCPLSVDTCMSENRMICNNHGNCICGECECSSHYSGPKCEQYILE